MKTKKFGRKLALNKKTIASLNTEQLLKVIGANYTPGYGCLSISGPGDICCRPKDDTLVDCGPTTTEQ